MASKKASKLNALERAIYSIAPAWAARRHQARATMALSGGYVGGQYAERFAYWSPGAGDADASISRDLNALRERSHDLVRNSPIAAGAIETQVTHVIGTGLTLQSRIDARTLGLDDDEALEWQSAAEREFGMWAESVFCDAAEEQSFYELQDLAFRARLEGGDAFVVLAAEPRNGWPYRLVLQVLEAESVSNPKWASDNSTLVRGIKLSESGRPIAVHVTNKHPGASYLRSSDVTWREIPIRGASGRVNVLHLKRKLRPGQTRGVPELAPIMAHLKQLDRFATAEVDAAVNSAAMNIFVKMDPDAFDGLFEDAAKTEITNSATKWDGGLNSGKAINLLPGESIDAPTPGRPNPAFDGFFQAVMKQIGIGLNIPHEVLAKHFQSSYSAARAALLDAWRTFRVRREWMAQRFCQPIYEEWLAEAVSIGRIRAPGFFADAAIRRAWCGSVWSGDGPGAIDPLKEASAAGERMRLGLSSLADEVVAYSGGDWEQVHRQRAREVKERREAGLEAELGTSSTSTTATNNDPRSEQDEAA